DALARGFVAADAILLGLATNSLPGLGFADDRAPAASAVDATRDDRPIGLYAIVDSSDAVRRVIDAGIQTAQLRIKRPRDADAGWDAMLRREAQAAMAMARAAGVELILNDHWQL